MILPIIAYGDPVLKKETEELAENDPNLKTLIADMFETMYKAKGVGLAAPQIGKSIRLFIIDGSPFANEEGSSITTQSLNTSLNLSQF
jgi:peptide deformylase